MGAGGAMPIPEVFDLSTRDRFQLSSFSIISSILNV